MQRHIAGKKDFLSMTDIHHPLRQFFNMKINFKNRSKLEQQTLKII